MTNPVVQAAAGSETGNRYLANFDVLHLDTDPVLAVVADGMGDSQGSALAGRTAVDTFVAEIRAAKGQAGPEVIRRAVATAQQRVGDIGRRLGHLAGCTLTALVGSAQGLWIAQVGDSRVYRLRAGLLELLTVDHTVAWLGAVHGWYPSDSAEAAAARYQLTRYVGHPAAPEPDVLSVSARPGDVFLLCSDGVAEQVPYQHLLEVVGQPAEPQLKVRQLLAAAEAAGGNDNATAIVVELR